MTIDERMTAPDFGRPGGEGEPPAGPGPPEYALTLLDRYGAVLSLDRAAGLVYGYRSDEVVGTHFSRFFSEDDIKQGKPRQALKQAEAAGRFDYRGYQVHKDGSVFKAAVSVTAVRDGAGELTGFVMLVRELVQPTEAPSAGEAGDGQQKVEELKRLYDVLSKASEVTVRVREQQPLFERVCQVLVEEGHCTVAWVGMVDTETQEVKPAAACGVEPGFFDSMRASVLEIPEGMGPTGTAIREDHLEIRDDMEHDPGCESWLPVVRERGYRSCASFPLRLAGTPVGALSAVSTKAGFFDDAQVALLAQLADDLSFAMESIDREEGRKSAEEAQRASEQYYRSLIENNLDIIAILDQEGRIGYTSPSVEQMLGYKRSEVRDRVAFEFLPENEVPGALQLLGEVVSQPGETREIEVPFRHKDGSFRTLEVVGRGFVDAEGAAGVMLNARDVTERKQVEEKVRTSEETMRALINALSDSAFLLGTDETVLAVNNIAARRLGVTVDEMLGRKLGEFFPPDLTETRRKVMAEATRTGQPVHSEDSRDGIHFEYVVYPVFGRDGEVERMAVVARDVTAARHAEEAQRKDRDFIQAVINTTGALVVVLDSDGRTILFNTTCEQTTGYSFDEVRGKRVWETVLVQDEVDEMKVYFETLRTEGFQSFFENHWQTKHGASRLIEWSNTVLFEEDGSMGYVIATGLDITERRKAEEALKQSEEQYRTMFESTGTAMCIADDEAVVSFMNQEFERMTGFAAEEVERRRKFTEFLLPEDVEGFLEYHREIRRVRRNVPIHFECRLQDKRGNVLNVLANMGLIPGRGVSVISLIDITREKSYEHDLQETAERLRHFLTVASHELRHPITIVKGYANTLTEYMHQMPEELIKEILTDIDNSTDRLTRYVDELMDVSRVEEGRFPVEKQTVDAEGLVSMALDDMKMLGAENEFVVQVVPGADAVYVDPEKFVQLLVILLENAVKFSTPASPVDIAVERNDEELLVSVMDRGPGIPEADREHVFERFYQVEDAMHHSTPGIGLGLYIAQEIASAHGGSIWCEDREGGGSSFRFSLPQTVD